MMLRSVAALAALLMAFLAASGFAATNAGAQDSGKSVNRPPAVTHSKAKAPTQPQVETKSGELPPRISYTVQDALAATVPGMPDVRFWGDAAADYKAALPPQPGPWMILSSGGADGAFGAGVLNGLSAAGKRQDYAVVTGVSTGALLAPFVFAGARYDEAMRKAFTTISAADVFEAGSSTGESFVNSWPLKEFIGKEITPELMADIAAAHRNGRRLFVVTTDLDAERSVVWNMGAIAAHGGEDAAKLFCAVLLASTAIPGGFPPVLIDVEANGKHFQEMHVDGGLGGQFFVAPPSLMASTSDFHLPATQLYIVVNTSLQRDFHVVDRFAPTILTQSIGMAVPVDTGLMADRTYVVAKRSGLEFNIASIPASFNAPSRGPFDPEYMKALFQTGYELGMSGSAFSNGPAPYPSGPEPRPANLSEKTGANQ